METIKRRIEKSAEATLSLGDMQFLKVKSLVSQDVEVADEQELRKVDAEMWDGISLDLRRGMWSLIKNLGKTTEADKRLFDACAQRVQEAKKPVATQPPTQ